MVADSSSCLLREGVKVWFVRTPKYALVSLLHLAPPPPVSAVSPLNVDQFSWELGHHSKSPARGICFGWASFGFKLGFSHSQSLKPAKRNKPSAYEHHLVTDEYLTTEVSFGRVAGPFPPLLFLYFTLAVLGIFQKRVN